MCGLCSDNIEEKESAKREVEYLADKLQRLSKVYYDLSAGKSLPHQTSHIRNVDLARGIIRELVEDWV